MSNTVPICGVCGDGGHGIQFPLFPKTEGAEYSAASFDTPEEEIILCLSSTSPER
jgi:hypothetical protein